MKEVVCSDIKAIEQLKISNKHVCEECIKTGSRWVHLRTCQTCGITLCCDTSPNKHMTQHYHETSHPVITSAQPGERWLWCYKHELLVEY